MQEVFLLLDFVDIQQDIDLDFDFVLVHSRLLQVFVLFYIDKFHLVLGMLQEDIDRLRLRFLFVLQDRLVDTLGSQQNFFLTHILLDMNFYMN